MSRGQISQDCGGQLVRTLKGGRRASRLHQNLCYSNEDSQPDPRSTESESQITRSQRLNKFKKEKTSPDELKMGKEF